MGLTKKEIYNEIEKILEILNHIAPYTCYRFFRDKNAESEQKKEAKSESRQVKKRVKKRVKYLYKVIMESNVDSFNAVLNKLGEQGYTVKRVVKLHVGWWALMQKRIWVKEEEAEN